MKRLGVARQRETQLPTTVVSSPPEHPPKVRRSGRVSVHRKLGYRLNLSYSRYRRRLLPALVVMTLFLLSLFRRGGSTGAEWAAKPRYVRHLYDVDDKPIIVQQLDINMEVYPSKRTVYVPHALQEARLHLDNSKDYKRALAEEFETDDCKAQYDWQKTSFPTCSLIHEADLTHLRASNRHSRVRFIAHGYFRDVWTVRDYKGERGVLKTLRYTHGYEPRHYDRHRRDAVAMERLTKSPHILDIYGFCGNSGLFEFADGGDLLRVVWPEKKKYTASPTRKLDIATQVAVAIAEMHNVDKEGQASMAHTDITPGQFVWKDNMYKLNDFNRARFLRWSTKDDKPCGYTVGNNPGKNRSPEEYFYHVQSEKVDVYSMGNIFYMLLSNEWPFDDVEDDEAKQKVMDGERPALPEEVAKSADPVIQAIKEAMIMCHEQDPTKRATARQVETFLREKLLLYKPDAIQRWGQP